MIDILICNLRILLAQRGLKITQVSKDTKISRTTLTALYYDNSKGIQMDTLNKLCLYLKTTPEHFFNYAPIDIVVQNIELSEGDKGLFKLMVNLSISDSASCISCFLQGSVFAYYENDDFESSPWGIDINLDLPESNDGNHINPHNNYIVNSFQKLTQPFQDIIESDIASYVMEKLNANNNAYPSFNWPESFEFHS